VTEELRVLHVINGLGTGGAERSLAELITALGPRGVSSQIACLHRRHEGVETDVSGRVPVAWLGSSAVARWRSLRDLLAREQPHIVHTTLFEADLLGRIASIRRPARVVTSLVNTPYVAARAHDPGVRPWRLRTVRSIDGLTARALTDHFIALTEAVKVHCVEQLRIPADRVTVVPRGRDPERLGGPDPSRRRATRAALGIGGEVPVVLNVARQEHQKGQSVLLHAFAELLRARPQAQLLVAGREGNATASLEAAVTELQLGASVRWLGHRDDVPDLLAAADAFAFPSRYEGQGGALLEAMAMGVPIVASDVPAIAETAPEGVARLVPPDDPGALARVLLQVLEDPSSAAEMARAGRARFAQRFTLSAMAEGTAAVYRKVMAA
jgi:glycosyltransferase involved in cell wall biosynthesis